MTPFPTLLALWNTQVYVHPSNGCNKTTNIEASVDKSFHIHVTLRISNIKLYDGHVQLGIL